MHRRFRDSVGSKLIFSVFDPNVRHAVQQRTLEFSGYNLDTGFRDGFVFRDYKILSKGPFASFAAEREKIGKISLIPFQGK